MGYRVTGTERQARFCLLQNAHWLFDNVIFFLGYGCTSIIFIRNAKTAASNSKDQQNLKYVQ